MRILMYRAAIAAAVALMFVGARQICAIDSKYKREAEIHSKVLAFKPQAAGESERPRQGGAWRDAGAGMSGEDGASRENSSIVEAKTTVNPDIVGWITIPGTGVDYPFVQGEDNSYYLARDIQKSKSEAGTIFMDTRANPDFLDFNTILYGHHMKNGSMFGELAKFSDQQFFDSNPSASIYLERETLQLDIFACLIIHPNNERIYNTLNPDAEKKREFLEYVRVSARRRRALDIGKDDRIVTLSTCAYDFDDARMVVLGRIKGSA